jgi:hypothetical protein
MHGAALVAIAGSKGFSAQTRQAGNMSIMLVNHDRAFKFAPAELSQMMAVSGAGPSCRGRAWVLRPF